MIFPAQTVQKEKNHIMMLTETLVETEPTRREDLFLKWYQEVFPSVAAYVATKGGSLDDARDIFQEALVIFYEKVMVGGFEPEGTPEAYLFGITKNLWAKAYDRMMRIQSVEDLEITDERNDVILHQRLLAFLLASGQKCMDILQAWYYEKLTMNALSARFGFASDRSATVQKYKCLEKVREQVKTKSLSYEDFTD